MIRQAHLAQIATADRPGSCRNGADRLGRAQSHPGSAGEVIDRHRVHVDARDQHAGQGRDHRGAHPIGPRLRDEIQRRIAGAADRVDTIAQAVATFERTIEPARAPFDRWVEGDEAAIPESAKRGFALFTGKAACFACHSGWRFTDDNFHDIGINSTDQGRGPVVKDEALNFAFKTPTLRSVALRAPYMHDASLATLGDVVRHYEKGGTARPSRSPLMRPIQLTDQERLDLVAFMETLGGDAAAPQGR